jgi:hypothetical protein
MIVEHAASTSFAVIGGRRIGKTSLLTCLHRARLPAAGFYAIYHDCSTTPSDEIFLATPITDWSPGTPPSPPATFGDLLHSPRLEKPCLLLLDEVDSFIQADRAVRWQRFNMFRALANYGYIQFVLSGERALREARRDSTSPLFNFANTIPLGPLDLHAVRELITRSMDQLEINLVDSGAIVSRIYSFTSGHPYIVQRLCELLIKRLNELDARTIRLSDVDEIVEDWNFIRTDFLETYFSRATVLEHLCALLMAVEVDRRDLDSIHQALLGKGIQATLNQTNAALERLVDLRSILTYTAGGYDFAVTAFPLIISSSRQVDNLVALRREIFTTAGDVLPEMAPCGLQGALWL